MPVITPTLVLVERSAVTADAAGAVENPNGADTGHVVLGVLGGIAFVIFAVVIIVPLMRWRRHRGSTHSGSGRQSRASSRRTHARIISALDAGAPLLIDQNGQNRAQSDMAMRAGTGAVLVSQRQVEPSRPPTAVLSRKILEKLPDFSELEEDESMSSLGVPLEPGERSFRAADELEAQNRSGQPVAGPSGLTSADKALLQPHRQETGASEQSQPATLVNTPDRTVSPTLPLTTAFHSALSPSLTSNISPTNSLSATVSSFRYPSLAASSAGSRSPEPPQHEALPLQTSRSEQANTAHARNPSWISNPLALVSGPSVHQTPKPSLNAFGSASATAWWQKGPMPSIPESLRSGSAPPSAAQTSPPNSSTFPPPSSQATPSSTPEISIQQSTEPVPTPVVARLRDLSANVTASSVPRHIRGLSAQTTGTLSRSNTGVSVAGSLVDAPGSVVTHATFGRPGSTPEPTTPPAVPPVPGHTQGSSTFGPFIPVSVPPTPSVERNTVPFPSAPSPTPGYVIYETDGAALRSRFSTYSTRAGESEEDGRRRTFSFPREPSPPLVTAPLSHPPLPHLHRQETTSRTLIQQPLPPIPQQDSQSSENVAQEPAGGDGALEREESTTYADRENADASSSTESLLPRSMPRPAPQLLPGVRPVSPFHFDFRFGDSSRSGTPAPGGRVSRQSTQASRASSKSKGSTHSKKLSIRSTKSGSSSRSTSRSRSKSRERSGEGSGGGIGSFRARLRGSRRVTFGVPASPGLPSESGIEHEDVGGHTVVYASASPRSSLIRPLPPIPIPPVPPLPPLPTASATTSSLPPPSSMYPRQLASQQTSANTSLTNDTSRAQDGHVA